MNLASTQSSHANGQYQSADRVYRDTVSALLAYNGLSPKTDTFTNEHGVTAVLLCLHGTIPILFKNVSYNIPIAAWVPYVYPLAPPIPFVQPTSSMLIRNGKHVDLEGKIYHPYLAYWHTAPDQRTIKELLSILQGVFQQEPPVYAKPAQPNIPMHQQPRPPQVQLSHPPYQSYHSSTMMAQLSSHTMPPLQSTSPSFDVSLPPPMYTPLPPHLTAATYNSNSGYLQPYQNGSANYSSAYSNSNNIPLERPPHTASPTMMNSNMPNNSSRPNMTSSSATDDDANVRLASLRSIVTDKLARIRRGQNTTKMESLLSTNRQLLDGSTRINDLLRRLTEEDQKISQNMGILDSKIKELDELLAAAKDTPKVNVDDIICGVTVLHNQLFEVVADDHAIDDALYCLGEAFGREKIDPNSYLKHIRALAREQFLKRALIRKIRTVAKLPI
ncbi:hypothetical protein SeLEV6574_g06056 [Synchytrium endobioticum]|uniref:UEV domain-containing protein n=1 Tax=Synchytrium endobioticum TaxID=286115 RepID=A0A507CR41_9FUNG|nr:hypothetical protein SeLEV6574_g06056 [Synchytrium endobioticum]